MCRSSIFNSDSLNLRGFRVGGLLVAAALLLAFEIGAARQDWLWAWEPRSQSGIVDALERQVIAPAPRPHIVFLGSSRMRDAILPRPLEQQLDLPQGSVLNLGLNSGTVYDALMLYERNREKLSQAQWIVVGVDNWHCNVGWGPNERDRRFAPLDERLSGYRLKHTVDLVVGWAWRTFDARDPIKRFVASMIDERPVALPLTDDGRIQWRREESDVGPQQVDCAGSLGEHYAHFTPSDNYLRHLSRLIDMAKADGVEVMVIQTPVRDAYMDAIDASWASVYEHYRQQVESLAGVRVHLFERAGDIGIGQRHYYDADHLTPAGAAVLTRRVGMLIDEQPSVAMGR